MLVCLCVCLYVTLNKDKYWADSKLTPSPSNNNRRARQTVHAVTFYNTVSEVRKTRFLTVFGFSAARRCGRIKFFFIFRSRHVFYTMWPIFVEFMHLLSAIQSWKLEKLFFFSCKGIDRQSNMGYVRSFTHNAEL